MRKGSFTARNWQIEDAPARIHLLGDKKRPESAQHIIEFPGGAIELSRLDDGSYWAHIIVNRGWSCSGMNNRRMCQAEVVDSRVGRHGVADIPELADQHLIEQIAVRIMPAREPR